MRWALPFIILGLVGCSDFVLSGNEGAQQSPPTAPGSDAGITMIDGAPVPPNQPPPQQPDQGLPTPDQQASPPTQPQPPTQPPPPSQPSGVCGNAFESECFVLVNQERQKGGLPPYVCNEAAGLVSRAYSKYMCEAGFFSHTGKDGSSSEDRMKKAGIPMPLGWAGENIAWGASTPAGVMKMWMNSWGHRAAIMSKSFKAIGIGYWPCGGNRSHFWTQNFL